MPETLTSIDVVAGVVLLLSSVAGAMKGGVRLLVGLIGAVMATGLAARHGASLGAQSWPWIAETPNASQVGPLVGSAVIFVGVLIATALVDRLLRRVLEGSSLSGLDRGMGLAFGATRGALVVMVAMIGLRAVPAPFLEAETEQSLTLSLTQSAADLAVPHLPEEFGAWLTKLLASRAG